jgi:hypothetical protein
MGNPLCKFHFPQPVIFTDDKGVGRCRLCIYNDVGDKID